MIITQSLEMRIPQLCRLKNVKSILLKVVLFQWKGNGSFYDTATPTFLIKSRSFPIGRSNHSFLILVWFLYNRSKSFAQNLLYGNTCLLVYLLGKVLMAALLGFIILSQNTNIFLHKVKIVREWSLGTTVSTYLLLTRIFYYSWHRISTPMKIHWDKVEICCKMPSIEVTFHIAPKR